MKTVFSILFVSLAFFGRSQDCGSLKECFMSAYESNDVAKMKELLSSDQAQKQGDSAKAYMNTAIGLIMSDLGQLDGCRVYLDKAVALDPKNSEDALIGLGNSYLKARSYDQAISYYDKIIANDEKSVLAHYFKGLTFYNQSKDVEAIESFKQAQKFIPVQTIQGTGDDAIISMQYGDNSIPKSVRAEIHYFVGYLTKDNQTAINELNKALKDAPNLAKAYHERGKRNYFLTNYQSAISDFNASLNNSNKANKYTWYYLGMSYYYSKNYAYAANSLTEAIKVDNQFFTAVYYEGMAIWYYGVDHPDQWATLSQRIIQNFEYVINNSTDTKLVDKAKKSLYDLRN